MNELKRSLEMRKESLVFLLKSKSEQIEIEKQHQIYGAIKEIEYIIRMMSYQPEEEQVVQQVLTNESSEEKVGVFRKMGETVRNFKSPIRIRFENDRL